VSNTGWTSVGEPEITPKISLVALWCANASVSAAFASASSGVRALSLAEARGRLLEARRRPDEVFFVASPPLSAGSQEGCKEDGKTICAFAWAVNNR
jgi:hypothetical protein